MTRILPPVRRDAVLRSVVEVLDRRLDGALPTDVRGLEQAFADDVDLLGALTLRWHARLGAQLDRALDAAVEDRPHAVALAWATTAEQMRGVRRLLDREGAAPRSPEVRRLLERSTAAEHVLLARAAGVPLASVNGRSLADEGRRLVRPALADRLRALVPA